MVEVDNEDEIQHDTSRDTLLDPSKVDTGGNDLQRNLVDKLDDGRIQDQTADVDGHDHTSSEHHEPHGRTRVADDDDAVHQLVHGGDDRMVGNLEVEVEDEVDVLVDAADAAEEDVDHDDEVNL